MATTAEYPGFPERVELIGTEGTAILAAGVVTVHYQDGRRERFGEEQATAAAPIRWRFPTMPTARCLPISSTPSIDQDRSLRVTGREALRVHHLIDAVLRSSAERRAIAIEAV